MGKNIVTSDPDQQSAKKQGPSCYKKLNYSNRMCSQVNVPPELPDENSTWSVP